MSGYADAAILDPAIHDDVTGYLPKPYARDDLAQAVRSALDCPATDASRPASPA